ncbi:MAG: response regulator [Nitrospinae bacterium]|nr:response regulator [Nitrospinota bacterium]
MKAQGFGDYLVERKVITVEQHKTALSIQNKNRLLGQIAREENYLNDLDVEKILSYMEGHPHMMFGEAAISLGYISATQLRYLLDLRTSRKVRIGEILVAQEFINEDTLHAELMNYNAKRKKLEKILVCDPSGTIGKLLESMLRKYGYDVAHAKSGLDALEAASKYKPDIIITSNVLLDMNGYELCKRLLGNPATAGIYSILLSSNLNEDIMQQAFDAGVTHFLRKPLKESELINTVIRIERSEFEKRPEKILIVDDSLGARMAIHKELFHTWSNLIMAENGEKALEIARREKPDIITMDVEMPVMGGLEACRLLKDYPETAETPVIFVTASDSHDLRLRGFEAGAVEYFSKPFSPGLLNSFIRMLCESAKIRKSEKILVVEDSDTTRHIIRYFLQKNGYNVYTAKNGQEAWEAMPKIRPDLIVLDCYMPKMDGFEFINNLKKNDEFYRIPVLMLTSSKNKLDVVRGFAEGAVDFITKPFDEAEMIARITSHLRSRKLLEELEEEKGKLKVTLKQLEDANHILERLSVMDGLTGLANRRHFDEILASEWKRAIRERHPISMLMIDIDYFKRYNDAYGHQMGDECIKKVAAKIKEQSKRSSDLAARYGGEEFALILPLTDLEGAVAVAEIMRMEVEAMGIPHLYSTIATTVTISVGFATVTPEEGISSGELVEMADKALYDAKHSGRNRVKRYNPRSGGKVNPINF